MIASRSRRPTTLLDLTSAPSGIVIRISATVVEETLGSADTRYGQTVNICWVHEKNPEVLIFVPFSVL